MSSVRAQLEAAREHIKAKRYTEARAILAQLDDDTARKWLAQLDERVPQSKPTAQQPQASSNRFPLILTAVIALIAVVAVGVVILTSSTAQAEIDTARPRLMGYCLRLVDIDDMQDCDDWYYLAFQANQNTVLACHRIAPELDAPFDECLYNEELEPFYIALDYVNPPADDVQTAVIGWNNARSTALFGTLGAREIINATEDARVDAIINESNATLTAIEVHYHQTLTAIYSD